MPRGVPHTQIDRREEKRIRRYRGDRTGSARLSMEVGIRAELGSAGMLMLVPGCWSSKRLPRERWGADPLTPGSLITRLARLPVALARFCPCSREYTPARSADKHLPEAHCPDRQLVNHPTLADVPLTGLSLCQCLPRFGGWHLFLCRMAA